MNSVNLHGIWWQVTLINLTRFSLFTNTSTSTFGSSPTFSLRSNPSEKVAIILQIVENTRCHNIIQHRSKTENNWQKELGRTCHDNVDNKFHCSPISDFPKVKSCWMLSKNPFEQNSVNSFQEKNRIQYLPHDLRTDWNLRLTELLILVKTNRQIRISRFTKLNTKAKVQVKRGLYIEILG